MNLHSIERFFLGLLFSIPLAMIIVLLEATHFSLADDSGEYHPPNIVLEPCYVFKKKPKRKVIVEKSPEKLQYQPIVDGSSAVKEENRAAEINNGSEYKQGVESVIDPKPSLEVKEEEIKEVPKEEKSSDSSVTPSCSCVRR